MYQKRNSIIQTFYAVMIGVMLIVLALIGINLLSPIVAAQDPATDLATLSPAEKLTLFGLSAGNLQAADVTTYNLQIVKQTNVSTVASGSPVTFTISITNLGPNPASYFVFYDNYPAQMKNVAFTFSTSAISGNLFNQQLWLFTNTLPISDRIMVTVTGILTSASDVRVENTAIVTAFNSTSDISTANNTSKVSVAITGSMRIKTIYLPVIYKNPPVPVLVYWDDFSNTGTGWPNKLYSDSNHCYSYYDGGKYRINIDASGRTCWRPAPSGANRVYGSFQVDAYISEGNSNAVYGIYSNGAGGAVQYLLEVWPNTSGCPSNGSWQFLKNGAAPAGHPNPTCHAAIGHGLGIVNTLKMTHLTDGTIVSYINNTPVYTYADGSAQLTGSGTGVYVASGSVNNVIKFDDFKVYTLPQ